LLADWKREQAEAGKPAATAELLKRLQIQSNISANRFGIPNAVGVSAALA